jgi:Tfp pilus assembly protein PilO
MMRIRVLLMRQVYRAGWPGAAGVALLVLCAAFYLSQFQGQQQRTIGLERELSSLRNRPQQTATPARSALTTDEQLAAFYAYFPSKAKTADILATLYAEAAKQSLRIERAEYRAVGDPVGRITRYQITLPVHGSYVQIRRFVAGLLTDIPVASIENVQFQRQKAGDASVEAKIRLVLYLGGAS